MRPANELMTYRANVTSQWGEDGIIAEIIRRLGIRSGFCVEFGAWDGKHLSNTWDLWHNRGWKAVLIEGDPSKFEVLAAQIKDFPQVIAHCALVGTSEENRLDSILKNLGVTEAPDLLSIDIDGDDRHVFEAVKQFLPRILVIEYNPTIPPHIDLAGRPGTRLGASALNICGLARQKGYKLVACTTTNLLFVKSQEFEALDIAKPTLDELMPRDHLTYVISDYTGLPYLTRPPTFAEGLQRLTIRTLTSTLIGEQGRHNLPAKDGLLPVKIFIANK